jgi:hypothetical protein
MKEYPSISTNISDKPVYGFDKLDGSNIRAEWSKKRNFYKFGKRHGLIDRNESQLGESVDLINEKYSDKLSRIFYDLKLESSLCFFEFFGPNSFAGNHEKEKHDVVLLDVCYNKSGFMEPKRFIETFSDKVEIAKLLYYGVPDTSFLESVKNGTLENMTFEGVVCKSGYISPGLPLMFKVKNQAWYDKLKTKYKDQPELFDKLK